MHQKNGGHQLPGALVDIEKGTKKFSPDMLEITKKEITKKGTFGLLKILGGAGHVPPVAPPPPLFLRPCLQPRTTYLHSAGTTYFACLRYSKLYMCKSDMS
jgi:hypothetical protein